MADKWGHADYSAFLTTVLIPAEHFFDFDGTQTIMRDAFHFAAPLGILGRLVERLVLTNYMTRFLEKRNAVIKQTAETAAWKLLLTAS